MSRGLAGRSSGERALQLALLDRAARLAVGAVCRGSPTGWRARDDRRVGELAVRVHTEQLNAVVETGVVDDDVDDSIVDNFCRYPIDIIYARVDTTVMRNTEATQTTGTEIYMVSKVYGPLTKAQAIELLTKSIEAPRVVSFGKAPKDGFTDADRVAAK